MRLDRGFGLSLMPSLSSSSSSSVLPVDRIGGIEVRVRTRELVRRPLVRGMEEVLVLLRVWLRASSSSKSWVLEFLRSGGLVAAMVWCGGKWE
ncbi:hypothetical protein HanRHA438_Chr14g0630151 [Helianthus annuus]|nr:hypothetical protein HanRHA438_Chr14g0630151 [Helianthus annuus]